MPATGKIYLFPVTLGDTPVENVIPHHNITLIAGIRHFVVENIRTARRFLRKAIHDFDIDSCTFVTLDGQTPQSAIDAMIAPALEGHDIGVLSEAGCPAVADPGADLVAVAQRHSIEIIPLVGPSSIILSLMGSGFNGQSFAFNGYLPIEKNARTEKLRQLERKATREGQTQIFIETPYRNNAMVQTIAHDLHPDTLLCVAANITTPAQSIITRPVRTWAKMKYDYNKIPAIFLIHGAN